MSATYCVVQYTVQCTKQYTVQCTKQHLVKCTAHVKYKKNSLQTNANIAVHLILHLSVKNTVQCIGQYHCRKVGRCMFLWNQGISANHFGIGGVYSLGYSVQHAIQCKVQYTIKFPGQYRVQCKVKFTGSKEGNVPCGVSQPNQAL